MTLQEHINKFLKDTGDPGLNTLQGELMRTGMGDLARTVSRADLALWEVQVKNNTLAAYAGMRWLGVKMGMSEKEFAESFDVLKEGLHG